MLLNTPLKNKTAISITPLIDVVFILLLFFMLSSTFQREKQIEMNSSLEGSQQNIKSKSHKILLDLNDIIFIDGRKYSLNSKEFNNYLLELGNDDIEINLSANPQVKTQDFIQLLDSFRSSGITKLNISKSELP